ncbi:MAG: hypothetical protein IPK25_15160 [Saprospiraceae bacterium]|nr:hypothetical protein [Saprospiraceae bacterium]
MRKMIYKNNYTIDEAVEILNTEFDDVNDFDISCCMVTLGEIKGNVYEFKVTCGEKECNENYLC